ncbi:alpha-N-acetyl-neuraminyl-2,3-beta-galactosyl-1,3-N-acetyl-galactosaminide alpha-2,6-sialyltransferase [Astyanax mexicanus]|uniref:Alpha-N-acetyl-neuraminyl-2,3-beta-galactosyl-1, 3-N-acetyl-galactosaminide alpha-2,6-sialyltransferase n=1 Tax=Astyanax mexicanus TaxID=7994 RepID=A0A8T2L7U2_ASTMX|nr:alpha-N-acetyl-neuraminyl-2,3-beta-galactosyl-1,3-N-acetyl-galactosaminide alpha-2,6-sialyltransferase [Astyanax mexicanus]
MYADNSLLVLCVQHLSLHCGHCAVVSSSGHMRGSWRGSEVDGHECVIRMNAAPTWGFEADVGNRTSVRVVSHTSVPHLLRREDMFFKHEADTLYVVWGPERNMRQDGKGRVFNTLVKLAKKYPRTHIYAVSRDKVLYCDRVFQEETGKNSVANHASVPYHYYELYRLDECGMYRVHERARRGAHRFITEKQVFARWAKLYNITFTHPAW